MQFSAISLYLAQSLTYKKICTKDIKLNSFYVGQASVEIKNNQMSTGEGYLFRACSSKGVNHNHLHFDRISKADRGMGQLYGGKEGRLQVCPNWRLLAWRSCRCILCVWVGVHIQLSLVGTKMEIGQILGKQSIASQVLATWSQLLLGFLFVYIDYFLEIVV